MRTGMLWFDNDSQSKLPAKIQNAVNYYVKKYERTPNLCLVHSLSETVEIAGLTVRAYRPVLPGHLWIGVEDKDG